MGLTHRLIARAGMDDRPEDSVAPVRLVAKDRGTRSSFGVSRAEMTGTSIEMPQDEQQMAAMPKRLIQRRDDDDPGQEAQARRQATAGAEEEEEAQARRQPGNETEEEEAQARRRDGKEAGSETEEEEAQAHRQVEQPPEEEEAQLHRALHRATAEESDDPAPLRRQEIPPEDEGEAQARRAEAPEEEQTEAQPLHRATQDGLPDEQPAEELRHDTAGATLDGAPRAMRAIPIVEGAPQGSGPTAPPMSGAPDAPLPPAPIDPALPLSMPAADRPRVVIDQIDVVVAEPGGRMHGARANTASGGARALLAGRYVKWR